MKRAVRFLLVAFPAVLVASFLLLGAARSTAQTATADVQWLGWNAWKVTSPTGKVIYLNPRLANPDSVMTVDDVDHADLVLVTNGHGDEVGNAVEIAQATGATVVPGSFELGQWFIRKGVANTQVRLTSPGERAIVDGIRVRVVHSIHGVGVEALYGPPDILTSGVAGAFIVTLENGWTLFYGGSGSATQDMAMWADMYKPDAAILYMGSSKEPMDFAMAVKLLQTNNPNLKAVFPGHHVFAPPAGQTTVAEAQQAVDAMGLGIRVTEPAPGVTYTLSR
jgi:L-ascorbate metabolism protein UlaG (beta-lactamase superfamily)